MGQQFLPTLNIFVRIFSKVITWYRTIFDATVSTTYRINRCRYNRPRLLKLE